MGFGTNNLTSRTTNFDPVSAMLGSSTTWGPEEQAAAARNQGWTVTGNQAQQFRNGVRYTRDLSNFLAPASQNQFANIPDVLKQAAIYDTSQMQGAADETYNKMNAKFGGIDKAINEGSASLENLGKQLGGDALSAARQAEQLGTDQRGELTKRADAMVGRVRGDVDKSLSQMPKYYKGLDKASGDIDEAYRLGDQAVSKYEADISQYKDLSAEEMSSRAFALNRNYHTQLNEIRAAERSGAMDPASALSAMENLKVQAGAEAQAQLTPLHTAFNDNLMQLKTQLAGIRQNVAGFRLQGAGLRGNLESQRLAGVGMEMQGAQVKAGAEQAGLEAVSRGMEAQRQMMQLGGSLRELYTNVASSTAIQAFQARLNGQTELAKLMMQNPRSVVGWFQTLLAMFSVNSTMAPVGGMGGDGSGTAKTSSSNRSAVGNPALGSAMGQQGGVGYGYGYTKAQPRNPGGASEQMGPPSNYARNWDESDFFE